MATTPVTGLLSPAASASSPAPSTPLSNSLLPTARLHPLKPGSHKEIALINYVDDKMLRVSRRYAKKYPENQKPGDDAPGYTSFEEVVRDLTALFEVVWISGTPAIQIPYLLSIAGTLSSYMPAFPFSTSLFSLTRKLDAAFGHILRLSSDSDIGDDHSSHLASITERVRIKSLVESTRVVAVEVASQSGHHAQIQDLSDSEETDTETDVENGGVDDTSSDAVSIGISKIYKQTLEILGDSLI